MTIEAAQRSENQRFAPTAYQSQNSEFTRESALWVLSAFCQYHRIPFDPALLSKELLPPLADKTLLRAAGALGLKARFEAALPLRWQSLARLSRRC
ncbi:MAG TPA: hypothetical protein VNM24_07340 [Burkholderiales bacterium]|nr:hypothetical protein [Burkholderiales bacterium]